MTVEDVVFAPFWDNSDGSLIVWFQKGNGFAYLSADEWSFEYDIKGGGGFHEGSGCGESDRLHRQDMRSIWGDKRDVG